MKASLIRRRQHEQQHAPLTDLLEGSPSAPPADPDPAPLQSQWTGGPQLLTKACTVALWSALAAGPVALLLATVTAFEGAVPAAAVATPAIDRTSEQAAVTEFAGRFVRTWLSSVRGQEEQLAPYVRTAQLTLPQTAWPAGPPAISDVRRTDAGVWTATVAITVGPTAAETKPALRYFAVPVQADRSGLVALALPAPVAAPPVTVAPQLAYRARVSLTDPVAASAQQFLDALLTGTGDVSRYVAPGTPIRAVSPAPYRSVKVTDVAATRELPTGQPADGAQLQALVTATATAGPEQLITVQYPLSLTVRGGRWEATAIDAVPAVSPTAATDPPSPPAQPAPSQPSAVPQPSRAAATPLN